MKTPIAIYLADTHLSEKTLEVNKSVFDQVFDLAQQNNITNIIHAGDIFDSRKGQPEVVLNTFKGILDAAAERGLKIIAIAGNHDKVDYTSNASILDVYDGHPAFQVARNGDQIFNEVVDLYFLPYSDENLTYPKALKELIANIADPNRINILVTHVGIDGVLSNSGILKEKGVTKNMFKDFSHVLIGHYHNRQLVGKHIQYTGSAYQANHGEDSNKGCTIIYDDSEDTLEFIKLDFPEYITINVLPDDIDSDLIKMVSEKAKEAKIRIRIDGDVNEHLKPLIIKLQESSKIEINKAEFTLSDTISNKTIEMTSGDILESFIQWGTDEKIDDLSYGENILKTIM